MNSDASLFWSTTIESVVQPDRPIPLWMAILVAVCGLAFAFWIYTSERGNATRGLRSLLALLRFALLCSVVMMMIGWSVQQFESEQPELVFVIDGSASMATVDMPTTRDSEALQSRFSFALDVFGRLTGSAKERILEEYQVRWYLMSSSLEMVPSLFTDPGQLVADGTQSRLGDGLSRLIERQSGRGTAAIVFVSDGINTAGLSLDDAQRLARSAAIPIYVLSVGRQSTPPDVRLADLLLDQDVYLGDRVTLQASVLTSDVGDAQVTVRLKNASDGRKLDETTLSFTADENQQTTSLGFVPQQAGEIALQLEVVGLEGESQLENNVLNTSVTVQDKTIRVLLVHGQPSYEFRFLKNLLERTTQLGDSQTSSFDLKSVLQESDPEYVDQDRTALRLVPSNPQTLDDYDVFIFGEFDPNLVSRRSQQVIYKSITESGAGCIFIYGAGSPSEALRGWPLGDLLPVQGTGSPIQSSLSTGALTGTLRWEPTSIGLGALPMQLAANPRDSARIWSQLPSFCCTCQIGQPKTGAQVLAVAAGGATQTPLLITQYAGAGRVALQATDETYLWTSYAGSDLYHQRYWGQMLRWLSRGRLGRDIEQSSLEIEPRRAKFQQPVRFETRLGAEFPQSELPENVQILIEEDNGDRETLLLSRTSANNRVYTNSTNHIAPGNYRAILLQPSSDSAPSQEFTITTPPGEQANLRTNSLGLKTLAVESRGRYYAPEEAMKLFRELPKGTPTRLGALPPIPLWNRWWVALAFVLIITTEWLIRRYSRML